MRVQDWMDEKLIGWIAGALIAAGALLGRGWSIITGMGNHNDTNTLCNEMRLWREEMVQYRKASEEQNRVVHSNSRAMNDLRSEISQLRVEIGQLHGRME